MDEKKLERKLRKRCRKLIKWARENGFDEPVSLYVNPKSGFYHGYTGPISVIEFEEYHR